MHFDLDPKIQRAQPRLMGSLYVTYHDDRCKVATETVFSNQSIETLTF